MVREDKMEEMLQFVREYKSKCEFNGVDFEADLYTVIEWLQYCIVVLHLAKYVAAVLKQLSDKKKAFPGTE